MSDDPDFQYLLNKIDQWMVDMSASKLVDSGRVVDMLLDMRLEFQTRTKTDEPVPA